MTKPDKPTPPLGDTPASRRYCNCEHEEGDHSADGQQCLAQIGMGAKCMCPGFKRRSASPLAMPTPTPVSEGTPPNTANPNHGEMCQCGTCSYLNAKERFFAAPVVATPSTDAGAGATKLDAGEGETWLTEAQERARDLIGALQILSDPASPERHVKAAANRVRRLFTTLHLQHAEQAAKIVELEAELAAINARKFPIQDGPDIPWSVIAPFEKCAQENHGGQTLERLAKRGGLSTHEALHVLLYEKWHQTPGSRAIIDLPLRDAVLKLQSLVARSPSVET